MKRVLTAAVALLLLLPSIVFASPEETEEPEFELSDEIERQISLIDLSSFDGYFEGLGDLTGGTKSITDLLSRYAEEGDQSLGLFEVLKGIVINELKASLGAITALVAAALLTSLSGLLGGERLKGLLSMILCAVSVALAFGAFSSLIETARGAVSKTGELTERATPILTALLASLGADASAGIFRPLLVFLAGTVVQAVEKVIMPLVLAGGVIGMVDPLTNGSRLSELFSLIKRLAKWLLGLLTAFYFGITAIRGLTVSARDGIMLRTAKYAIDKLVPVVGGMVSGTADSVMGCALLIKNGFGCVTIVVLVSLIARPLIVLGTGAFIFRASAALSQPAADKRAVALFSNTADMVSLLFACAAACGCMLILTVVVFIAAGGITAGLW